MTKAYLIDMDGVLVRGSRAVPLQAGSRGRIGGGHRALIVAGPTRTGQMIQT